MITWSHVWPKVCYRCNGDNHIAMHSQLRISGGLINVITYLQNTTHSIIIICLNVYLKIVAIELLICCTANIIDRLHHRPIPSETHWRSPFQIHKQRRCKSHLNKEVWSLFFTRTCRHQGDNKAVKGPKIWPLIDRRVPIKAPITKTENAKWRQFDNEYGDVYVRTSRRPNMGQRRDIADHTHLTKWL